MIIRESLAEAPFIEAGIGGTSKKECLLICFGRYQNFLGEIVHFIRPAPLSLFWTDSFISYTALSFFTIRKTK